MSEYFTTQFGDKIFISSEVEKKLYPNSIKNSKFYQETLSSGCVNEFLLKKEVVKKISLKSGVISNDLYSLGCVLDLLDEIKIIKDRKFKKCLDIGGAEGVHAAILRGLMAKKVHVADAMDGRDPFLTLKLLKELYKYFPFYIIDKFIRGKYGLDNLFYKITGYTPASILPRNKNYKHQNSVSVKNFYHFMFNQIPKVDKYLLGNWFEEVNEIYDIIVTFQCMWLWNHKQVFKKVSDILENNGIFCMMTPYCWAGRSSGDSGYLLGGKFAYFEQRLTKQDIQNYYDKFKPDVAKWVNSAYEAFDPNRPTINDYIDEAYKNGLVLEGVKRIYDNLRYDLISNDKVIYKNNLPYTSPEVENGPVLKIEIDDILKNIRRFRKDVELEDLRTRAVVMVFRKIL